MKKVEEREKGSERREEERKAQKKSEVKKVKYGKCKNQCTVVRYNC